MSKVSDIRVNLEVIYGAEIQRIRSKIDAQKTLEPSDIERLVSLTRGAKELQQFERSDSVSEKFRDVSTEELLTNVRSKEAGDKMGAVE